MKPYQRLFLARMLVASGFIIVALTSVSHASDNASLPSSPKPQSQEQELRRTEPWRDGDLAALPVCEISYRRLVSRLKEQQAALYQMAKNVAYTSFARRNRMIACLRTELDLGALLPDDSAMLIGKLAVGNNKVISCAAWVRAPLRLPLTAAYIDAPTMQDPQQYIAFISADDAVKQLHQWNGWLVYNGKQLPPGTVYFAFHGEEKTMLYGSGRIDELPGGRAEILALLESGDIQTIASIARFAAISQGQSRAKLYIFTGMHEVVTDDQATPQMSPDISSAVQDIDQRAVAQALAKSISRLTKLGHIPPELNYIRLVLSGEGEQLHYHNRVEEVVLSNVDETVIAHTSGRDINTSANLLVRILDIVRIAATGLGIIVFVAWGLTLVAVARRRKIRVANVIRDPNVQIYQSTVLVLSRLIAASTYALLTGLLISTLCLTLIAIVGVESAWLFMAAFLFTAGTTALIGSCSLRAWLRIHRKSGHASAIREHDDDFERYLAFWADKRTCFLWQDYHVLAARAQGDQDSRNWAVEKQLRTNLLGLIQSRQQISRERYRSFLIQWSLVVGNIIIISLMTVQVITADGYPLEPIRNSTSDSIVIADHNDQEDIMDKHQLPDVMKLDDCGEPDQPVPRTAIPFLSPPLIRPEKSVSEKLTSDNQGSPTEAYAVPTLDSDGRKNRGQQREGAASDRQLPQQRTPEPIDTGDSDPSYRPGILPIEAMLPR